MRGITKYILRQLVGAMVFVTLALTGVVWLTNSLRFVELIVNRGLSIATYLHFTALLLPTFLSLVLPFALFCAVVYTYHRLTVDSELVVLRAAGLDQLSLARPALILAGLVTLVGYGLTLYVTPWGYREFRDRYLVVRGDYSHILLREGTFNNIVDGITVYVRDSKPSGDLLGILIHDNRDRESPVTMMAERGALLRTAEGPLLLLERGNRQEIDADGQRLRLLYFDRNTFDLSNLEEDKEPRWRKPRERYIHELFHWDMTERDRAHIDELRAEGHQRLVLPLYGLVFTLIGLAATLAGEFNQRSRVSRAFVGAVVVIVFQVVALVFGNFMADVPALTPLLYANVVLAGGAAVFVLSRTRLRRAPAAPPRVAGGRA